MLSRALVARHHVRAVLAVLCMAMGVLACSGPAAQAALVHPLLGSFGSFNNVQGVAVDQVTGDVYVYDAGAGAVYKFDSTGAPENFSGLGSNVITEIGGNYEPAAQEIAVDSSSGPDNGDIYVANNQVVRIYSAEGTFLGELSGGEACGVAVDPSGNVYVGFYPETVRKYTPATNPVENADETTFLGGLSQICNDAVDSEGSLYAATYSGGVSKYESLQFGSPSATGALVDEAGTTLAIDPSNDDVYIDDGADIAEYDSSGSAVGSFGTGTLNGSAGIAVKGGGNVYTSDGSGEVDIFGPAVAEPEVTTQAASVTATTVTLNGTVNPDSISVSACEFEYGAAEGVYDHSIGCSQPLPLTGDSPVAVSAEVSGLSPNATYHYRLAATNSNGSIHAGEQTFTAPGPPVVDGESVSNVGFSTAVTTAQINPENNATTYHVEYGSDTSYGQRTVESASIGSDDTEHTISVELNDLAPNTLYHWRVVATSSLGTTNGAGGTFVTYQQPAGVGACSNEDFRTGSSADLSDCRAYEKVSPADKGGGGVQVTFDVSAFSQLSQAATSGEAVAYSSRGTFAGSAGSIGVQSYIARRTFAGWLTQGIGAPQSPWGTKVLSGEYTAFSPDLSIGVLNDIDTNGPLLAQGAVPGYGNLYLRNTMSDSYTALTNVAPPEVAPNSLPSDYTLNFEGASADFGHVLFTAAGKLTPDAQVPSCFHCHQLYEWTPGGRLSLVNVLPENAGSTVDAGAGGHTFSVVPESGNLRNAISADGSRVYWSDSSEGAGSGPEAIYLREDESRTVAVGHGLFWVASPDGAKALYTSQIPGAGGAADGGDLYEFDAATGQSTDLTPSGHVQGLLGASSDLSYVYFVAQGNLAPGATEGDYNVYLRHAGKTIFIAAVPQEDGTASDTETTIDNTQPSFRLSYVTPDGRHAAFVSQASLTGYDDTPIDPQACKTGDGQRPAPCRQVYLYSADDQKLICASCNPSGARPIGPSSIVSWPNDTYDPRSVSDDGTRVFFNSTDALVPRDTNGQQDVYEWESPGAGSCGSSNGCVSLLSSGSTVVTKGNQAEFLEASFVDATPSGSDVFFITPSQLVPGDTDQLDDLYDARVGGGFPQEAAPPCTGTGCQGVPAATPIFATPSSTTFNGVGNFSGPASKAAVKSRTAARSRAEKLANALKGCRGGSKKARAACERRARKRYGPKPKSRRKVKRADAKRRAK